MTSLGERLRFRRWEELRFLQQDVAAAAGISASRLSEIEHDRHRVTEPTLRRLAAVLALDPDELVDQARREDRLARKLPARGDRSNAPVGPLPNPVPVRPRPNPPAKPWLTSAEAARMLDYTAHSITVLVRRGHLAPVRYLTGRPGRPRLEVATAAVLAYRESTTGVTRSEGSRPVPDGYVSLPAFAEATGLSHGALHRRLVSGEIVSIRTKHRRFIPEAELARWLAKPGEERHAVPVKKLVVEPAPPSPSPSATERQRPYSDPSRADVLGDLPLDGIKAAVIRLRYGTDRLTHRAIGEEVGMSASGVRQHETAALRILRQPIFREFSCGLARDHPLRLAIFRVPGLEDELCSNDRGSRG